VPGDHRARCAEPERRRAAAHGRAIELQVAPAHAGSLDFEDHFAGSGLGIRELAQFELPVAEKDDAFHCSS
jgi:hypothetical protein